MARVLDHNRTPSPLQFRLGGTAQTYNWQWQGQPLTVAYETVGLAEEYGSAVAESVLPFLTTMAE